MFVGNSVHYYKGFICQILLSRQSNVCKTCAPAMGLFHRGNKNFKAHILRAMTPAKFVEHELLVHMFI